MQKQQGFTLVELVIVIVILGILAVTAAPKFLNLAGDARQSTLAAVQASLQSANSVIFSKAVLQNVQNQATETVDDTNLTGGNVAVAFGFVAGTQAAVAAVLELDGNFTVIQGVVNTNLTPNVALTDVMIYPADLATVPGAGTTTAQACLLVYRPSTGVNVRPVYTIHGDGC